MEGFDEVTKEKENEVGTLKWGWEGQGELGMEWVRMGYKGRER